MTSERSMADAPEERPTDRPKQRRERGSPAFDTIALLLQGGGALGAYQGGVYQALAEAKVVPDWVGGISIGAVNAALIAGNPSETRVARLREFWEGVSNSPLGPFGVPYNPSINYDAGTHRLVNQTRAFFIALCGAPSFFAPRFPPSEFWASQRPNQLSFYDIAPLKATLERLVDFDRINNGDMRLSVGAVNVRSGNLTVFDTTTHKIDVRHIVASGSLPPGFPGHRNRRRILLGRRDRFEHAPAIPARRRPAPRHARLSGRSVERFRRVAGRYDPGGRARKGYPLFQPHARRDRTFQDGAASTSRGPAGPRSHAGQSSQEP
jgi:predicted acylesterase/phospholipase RssA